MSLSRRFTKTRFSSTGTPRKRSRTDSNFLRSSSGMPGKTYTFSTTTTGNQRSPASINSASSGTIAILSWLSFGGRPWARSMRSAIASLRSTLRPKASATPSMVRSSCVGPMPPEVNTTS